MSSSSRHHARAFALVVVAGASVLVAAGCSGGDTKVVIKPADDIQVLTPKQVRDMRASAGEKQASSGGATGDTVPQNEDKRPVEQRIFEAYSKFRGCIEDSGETIRGNLQDPNNPAFKDPDYVQILSKCASRSNIIEVLEEFQSVRANLTPDQVKERNESFKKLQPCLEKRGWTIETSISDIGLIEPTTFVDSTGDINERDVSQCAAEVGIDEGDLN